LAAINVTWLEGRAALAELIQDRAGELQRNTTYVTGRETDGFKSVAGLQTAYSFIEAGGWFATPANATPAYCKPAVPRMDETRQRVIKYETARGAEAKPLLPNLLGGQTWAEIEADPDQPIFITEGFKKALAIVQYGYPAIALRGVTQWHPKGVRALWPEIERLAAGGRRVIVAFDEDDKLQTRLAVGTQALRLGEAISRAGGKPAFARWRAEDGKGIDDYLVNHCDPVDALAEHVKCAIDLKAQRRNVTLLQAKNILNLPAPVAQHNTTGEYLPTLPALVPGAAHWLAAPMNSGKTVAMGRDWVKPWIAAGGIVAVLSPLNSLGMQTAQDWGLPHIHDYKTDGDSRRALEADISARGGLVACFNSVHRVIELIPSGRPLLVIIDEASQVMDAAAEGGTLRGVWASRWEQFIALSRRAVAGGGAIALAEDGLDQATIDLVRKLAGASRVIGIRHTKELQPWQVTLDNASDISWWRGQVLQALQAGRLLFVTSSQAEAKRLEWAVTKGLSEFPLDEDEEPPAGYDLAGLKVVRIDSETNEGGRYRQFFEAPESWLYQEMPDLLILSPSAKTGLSIEGGVSAEGAFFDGVWGFFPSLDTDTAMQLLGRYRPPVPRRVWVPEYIQPSPGETSSKLAIVNDLEGEGAKFAAYGGFSQAATDADDQALREFLAARRSRRWAQKVCPGASLGDRLEAAGHGVSYQSLRGGNWADNTAAFTWRWIKECIARADSGYHAGLQVDHSTHTYKWAKEQLGGLDSTHETRCLAAKVIMHYRFPGMNWDDSDTWYYAEFAPRHPETGSKLVVPKFDGKDGIRDLVAGGAYESSEEFAPCHGPVAPGAALWAEAGYYSTLWGDDAREAQELLTQRLRGLHLLPQAGARAMLAAVFRPMIEKLITGYSPSYREDIPRPEIRPDGEVEAQIKALALRYANEIRRYWRLSVTAEQSVTAVVNKILRKFGFLVQRYAVLPVGDWRPEAGPYRREYTYKVMTSAIWRGLVVARQWALSQGREGVTNLLNSRSNEFVTNKPIATLDRWGLIPIPPPLGDGGAVAAPPGELKTAA
jgi:hypothetical protein